MLPHVWKWAEIEPYLHRIAEIAPLEFTERQQFLLTNPGLSGALRVTNTIRVAVSIYKPGDQAPQHLHTPSASRTILSDTGGYTLIEGEQCAASRGDLIFTPAGTWHGHGNDDQEPVIWMDVLDWPLLEYLDLIWMRHDIPDHLDNASPETGFSQKLYGTGGLVPRFLTETRGSGRGGTPMFHFRGADVRQTLASLRDQAGSPWDGILVEFINPMNGRPVFPTLTYKAQLLRPGEQTAPSAIPPAPCIPSWRDAAIQRSTVSAWPGAGTIFWSYRQICGDGTSTWRRQATQCCTRSLTSRCSKLSATTVLRDARQPATRCLLRVRPLAGNLSKALREYARQMISACARAQACSTVGVRRPLCSVSSVLKMRAPLP